MIDLPTSTMLDSSFRPQLLDAYEPILKPPRFGSAMASMMRILKYVCVEHLMTEYIGWLNDDIDRLLRSKFADA